MSLALFVGPAEKRASHALSIIPSQVISFPAILVRMTNGQELRVRLDFHYAN
jgi:hypothetical protein